MPTRRRQSGSSLIEVLVSVVVISIGLLGLAGLQLYSMQNTNSASQRITAVTLGYDILERMRANRRQALEGAYDINVGADPVAGTVAGDDLIAWKSALEVLPGGDGGVLVEGLQITITVQWQDAVRNQVDEPELALVRLRTEL